MPPDEETQQPFSLSPEKLFFKIGEVSRITSLEPHVIRYWESMLPMLKPKKSSAGQRLYSKKEIDLILYVKRLQVDEGYTIEGIKRKLSGSLKNSNEISQLLSCNDAAHKEAINFIRGRLLMIIEGIK